MKNHKFSSTHIDHHDDGSMTVHHMHEDGSEHDVKHAVGDHDSMIDSLCDNLDPEKIEGELDKRGIDSEKLEEAIHPGLHDTMEDLLK